MAADMALFENTFTIYGKEIFEKGAVAVSLNGDFLNVYNDYNLGWRPVGPKFTITKSKDNRVYEINNRPIIDIYTEVLGEDVIEHLPASAIEFPLIKNNHGTLTARTMIAKMEDNSIVFAGNLNEGDIVQFALGSSKLVTQYHQSEIVKKHKEDIQASFIYSCSARKQFLGYSLESSFNEIAQISPSAGFFTYGEFFNSKNICSFLNITTTVLFLNEKGTKTITQPNSPKLHPAKNLSTTEKATFHFMDYISKELKEREHAISYTQNLADQYLNAIDTTLIVSKTDTNGIITFANDKFEKISGYSTDELIGMPHNIVRHPENPDEIFKEMWETIKSGKTWHGSFSNARKDGSTYYVSSSIIPIKDLNGKIIEYIAVREDITELMQAKMEAENAEKNQANFFSKYVS
jgi:PAS domain S-box-containing protein